MIDRFSLRWRVPAIIALIVVSAVLILATLAYTTVRASVIHAAQQRLQRAVTRVAEATGPGVVNISRRAIDIADDAPILDAMRRPGAPLSPEARQALHSLRTDTTLDMEVALLDRQGRSIEGVIPELQREGPVEVLAPIEQVTIHPFRSVPGGLEYIVAVPVRDSGRVVGQIVQWRRLSRVAASMRLISDLIGSNVVLLVGNADGSLISELADTTRPPVLRDSASMRSARAANLTASASIPGTPWAFYVEYPNEMAVRAINIFSWQSTLVVLGVLLLAVLAGHALSRGMTAPLADLTVTAESIAAGDLDRRPDAVARRDEIGRLARSFGTMADNVREARDQLERRIEARTADLRNAMTQLRDAQDELVRKERLATMGQLASSVGHELRNPLGVMSNAVYILDRTIPDPNAKTKEYLRVLENQIRLSERIVGDLLDSARNPSPRRQRVNVRSLVVEQMDRIAVPPHVRVEVAVDDALPDVHVDPDQVGQILVNLFTNATQAMDTAPGLLRVHARNGDGRVKIEVRDTGPGVAPDMAEKIFEPLYTTKARGIGLGLSVSRSLAVANQGSLTVVNHPAGGAIFTLDLPTGESA